MPTLQDFLEILKIAPRYFAAIGLFCAIVLFLPEGAAQRIGIHDFVQDYAQWLGITLIATLSILAVIGCEIVVGVVRDRSLRMKIHKSKLERLHSLTEEEKQILRFYIGQQSKTNILSIKDGVVNGLVHEGIIHRAASQGHIIEGFAHNIDEMAWAYLNKHAELLDGTTLFYRTDKVGHQR